MRPPQETASTPCRAAQTQVRASAPLRAPDGMANGLLPESGRREWPSNVVRPWCLCLCTLLHALVAGTAIWAGIVLLSLLAQKYSGVCYRMFVQWC